MHLHLAFRTGVLLGVFSGIALVLWKAAKLFIRGDDYA